MDSAPHHHVFDFVKTLLRPFFMVALALILSACVPHKPQPVPHLSVDHGYVDLQPGWRIRVVIPILRGGGFQVLTEQARAADGTVQMKASEAFIGFEIDYYSVDSVNNESIVIRFVSAMQHTEGAKRKRKSQPLVSLFVLPAGTRHVRLLFLTRVSADEHNSAILGANSSEALSNLSNMVESNPAQNCINKTEASCTWVPEGISVQPEKKNPNDPRQWIPAV